MSARSARPARQEEAAGKVCPVCTSVICALLTHAASIAWRQQAALRARTFHNPDAYGVNTTDPGTICQTTRKPLPTVAA